MAVRYFSGSGVGVLGVLRMDDSNKGWPAFEAWCQYRGYVEVNADGSSLAVAKLEAIDSPPTYIGTVTIPDRMSKKKDVDPKEEALYKRWTGNAGSRVNQANCGYQYPGVEIQGYQGTPWFHGHEERIVSARAQMKRWVSSNHKDWPTCQHGHAINLVQIVREAKGGDGYLAFPKFECWGCR